VVDTSASTTIDGTFYLTLGESRTPDLPSIMSAAYLKSEMENLPGIYTVDVTRSTIDVSVESYSWTVSFVAYDDIQNNYTLKVLYFVVKMYLYQ
jgi:hypothetical protein